MIGACLPARGWLLLLTGALIVVLATRGIKPSTGAVIWMTSPLRWAVRISCSFWMSMEGRSSAVMVKDWMDLKEKWDTVGWVSWTLSL